MTLQIPFMLFYFILFLQKIKIKIKKLSLKSKRKLHEGGINSQKLYLVDCDALNSEFEVAKTYVDTLRVILTE